MAFGPSNDQKQANNLLNSNAQQGSEASKEARQAAQGFLGQFSNTIAAPTNYFSRILSGDKTLMGQAIAPAANAISSQFDTAARQVRQGVPRGGYASTILGELPFQKAAAVGGLFSQLQPMAASGLLSASSQLGNTGANLMNSGSNYLGVGTQAANAYEQAATQQQQAKMNAWMGLGQLGMGALTGGLGGGLFSGIGSIFKPKAAAGAEPPGGWWT